MGGRPVGSIDRLVRDSRELLGLTQQELARRSGVSVGTIRDLEQGRSSHPHARSIHALADVLGLSPASRALLHRLAQRRRPEPVVASEPVQISVLGRLTVRRSSRLVTLGSGRHRIVLARLALTPNHPVSREELIDLLWGTGDTPPSASNVLQTHVSRLRRVLRSAPHHDSPGSLTLTPGGYCLQLSDEQLDLLAYRSRLAHWRQISPVDPQRAFDLLGGALDMWQGNYAAEDIAEMQGDPLVTALSDEFVDATIRLSYLGQTLRRLPEVLPRLRMLADRHSWHEALHARLIVALAASGQQAAALDAYRTIRGRLANELGLDPGADLVDAHRTVLEQRWHAPERVLISADRGSAPRPGPALPADFTGRASQSPLRLLQVSAWPGPTRCPACRAAV